MQFRYVAEPMVQVDVVVDHGAIADDIGINLTQFKLSGNRRSQDPGLGLEAGGLVDGEGTSARDFVNESDIEILLF
jgi:hypothetical protein